MAGYLQPLNEPNKLSVSTNATSELYLIGRFHEIGLKGRNRWRFVDELKRNLVAIFADYRLGKIRGEGLRLKVAIPDEVPEAVVRERAALLFGLQNFSLSRRVENDIGAITQAAVDTVSLSANGAKTFRVSARRTEKRFALNSMEIDRIVGAEISERFGLKVKLDNPDFDVTIEILPDGAYISAGKLEGAGGLPVGVTGLGMVLLSGGIDSPVAAYRMMRRGLRVNFVHFHSYPLVSSASREKACDLAAHLTRYEARSTLYLVPFADVQRTIVARAPRPLRVILYRRFMLRISEALAAKHGAQTLVTGESLGQVASQTLENMTVIQQAITVPVLRPLIGMDKTEIVTEARRLGTFETSILPDQDCCSLFVPAHPETRARLDQVMAAEAVLDVDKMVAQAVLTTEAVQLTFPLPNSVAAS